MDEQGGAVVDSPGTKTISPPNALELPTPERLLPVGGEKVGRSSLTTIVTKLYSYYRVVIFTLLG